MGADTDNDLQARAIEWHVRLRHGDDTTWDAFAVWLAQDTRHQQAYEAIEHADQAIEPLLAGLKWDPPGQTEPDKQAARHAAAPSQSRRRWLGGAALAASIAAAAILLPQLASGRYEITTAPGQRRTVALDSTTEVLLNGSTHMTFDRKNPRFASLASGEALFRVHHDNAKPFTLELGNSRVVDVGTVFNVVRDSSEVRVAVAEGKVTYNTQSQRVPLTAGQAVLVRSDSPLLRVSTMPVTSIGAWQAGRLVYSGERLSRVASDLERSLGIHIGVSPGIADRPFSGTLVLNGAGSKELERLKLVLNVDLEAEPTGWMMKPVNNGDR